MISQHIGLGCLFFFLLTSAGHSDTVKLKTGTEVEGKILEEGDGELVIDFNGSRVTYYADEIESVTKSSKSVRKADIQGLSADHQNLIKSLISRFSGHKTLSLHYSIAKLSPSMPSRSNARLIFLPPDKISFRVDGGKDAPFFISDGRSVWVRQVGTTVLREDATERLAKFDHLQKSMQKLRDYSARQAGEDAPEGGYQESLYSTFLDTHPDVLKSFGVRPFEGIKPGVIEFAGEETLNGEAVYKFFVNQSDANRRAVHWIGKEDGVPRKIQDYNPWNDELDTEITISQVRINVAVSAQSFVYNESSPVTDRSKILDDYVDPPKTDDPRVAELQRHLQVMAKREKKYGSQWFMDVPPEITFEDFFENPVSDVTGLKGGGMVLIGGEVYIHFRSNKRIVLKNRKDFAKTSPEEAKAWAVKAFPEAAADLTEKDEYECLAVKRSGENAWFLVNKTRNHYFFRASGGGP